MGALRVRSAPLQHREPRRRGGGAAALRGGGPGRGHLQPAGTRRPLRKVSSRRRPPVRFARGAATAPRETGCVRGFSGRPAKGAHSAKGYARNSRSWVMGNPIVTVILVPRTMEQFEDSMAVWWRSLEDEATIDALVPRGGHTGYGYRPAIPGAWPTRGGVTAAIFRDHAVEVAITRARHASPSSGSAHSGSASGGPLSRRCSGDGAPGRWRVP